MNIKVQAVLLVCGLCCLPCSLTAEELNGHRFFFSAEERKAMTIREPIRHVDIGNVQVSQQSPEIRLNYLGIIIGEPGKRSFWSISREGRQHVMTVNSAGKEAETGSLAVNNGRFKFRDGWIGEKQDFSIKRTHP